MGSKKKTYVVWKGRKPGIYTDWDSCRAQIFGYPGAKYKSFDSSAEARHAFEHYPEGMPVSLKPGREENARIHSGGFWESYSICVDAACSGNPGLMEYRGVDTVSGTEIFRSPVFPLGTNNIGEFLAIVHALALYHEKDPKRIIYSDSMTAIGWIYKGKAKSNLPRQAATEKLWELIDRAEKWLASHMWNNPLVKWETDQWGEIPADFGRK